MIGILFKCGIAFVVSFLILSFQVNQKTIFYHMTEFTGPLGEEVQKSLGKSVKRSFHKSKKLGEGFFKNADPKILGDTIRSSQSSLSNSKGIILEEIKKDETRKLDELINKN